MLTVVAAAESSSAVQAPTPSEERRGRDGSAARRDASTHQEAQLQEERQDASSGAHQALGAVMGDEQNTRQREQDLWRRAREGQRAEETRACGGSGESTRCGEFGERRGDEGERRWR
ncbi:uncharacterized protein LOC110269912 [Arachis ipaensis]|uniref:uncharacterized protein LOC110269912 n=1 Tax=Arachis ipaensis TaxID=130454 RepID=UPI000A2B089B|nr:uncharacterized protein LOC110269912 [Arachis ipaensis]